MAQELNNFCYFLNMQIFCLYVIVLHSLSRRCVESLFHVITCHLKRRYYLLNIIFFPITNATLFFRKINYPTDLAMTTYRDWKGWAEEEVTKQKYSFYIQNITK